MIERQNYADDFAPGRWVPVLDAVEAVMERILRDEEGRQGQRSENAAPA